MKGKYRLQEQTRLDNAAAEAIAAPGPFTKVRAGAILAARLPHGRITTNLDPHVHPLDPPPNRGMECHVEYLKVDGIPYGHIAVYADGVVYAYKDDRWSEVAPE